MQLEKNIATLPDSRVDQLPSLHTVSSCLTTSRMYDDKNPHKCDINGRNDCHRNVFTQPDKCCFFPFLPVSGTPDRPTATQSEEMKTATSILLEKKRTTRDWSVKSFGDQAEEEYAIAKEREERSQVKSDLALFRNFKMELFPRRGRPRRERFNEPTVTSEDKQTTLSVLEVIIFALEYIKDKVLKRLHIIRPMSLEATDIHWVLTVPAIWNDFGKGVMREAAFRAGLILRREDTVVSDGTLMI